MKFVKGRPEGRPFAFNQMRPKLLYFITFTSILAGFFGPGSVHAANEQVDLTMDAKPLGSLFKEVPRPVDASLTVKVSSPETESTITPLKVANVAFPRDMYFYPDPRKTPVCSEDQVGPESPLSLGILAIVELCPKSVIGTGTAVVQIARNKGPSPIPTLLDPQMVVFNAGLDDQGRPKITIYGFSKYLNSGLVMTGSLARSGQLKINIGVMPFDSSVSEFVFNVPGAGIEVEDAQSPMGTRTIRGLDPAYLRSKCSTGSWDASGSFVLGRRDDATKLPFGEETRLESNSFSLPCKGLAGRADLRMRVVGIPKVVGTGRYPQFAVRLNNSGTASARAVKLVAQGRMSGSIRFGKLAPGKSRTIKVRLRAAESKGSGKVRFRLSGKGFKTVTTDRPVRIR